MKKVIDVNWFCGCCGKDIEQTKESVIIFDDSENIQSIYKIANLPCADCVVKHFDFGTEENNIKIVSPKKKIKNPENDIYAEEVEEDEEEEETNKEEETEEEEIDLEDDEEFEEEVEEDEDWEKTDLEEIDWEEEEEIKG